MYPKIAQLKDVAAFRARLVELNLELPVDDRPLSAAEGSPLAAPLSVGGFTVGNRWCIHPMEGWDANPDGSPSDLVRRRWRNFGASGAKLIWGGEAAAVQPDGRANPRQTLATPENQPGLASLLRELRDAHRQQFGTTDDLLVGLQLTHSGRFCRPRDKRLEPRIAYHHPLLDARFGIDPADDSVVWTDSDLERLIDRYVVAAGVARSAGFQFVDLKACHGYLVHEFLSAFTRPGRFGGDFAGRTRMLRTLIERVHDAWPDLLIGVRLSAFDLVPFQAGGSSPAGGAVGQPTPFGQHLPYRYAFGADQANPLAIDLTETVELLRKLKEWGVAAVNVSCGSPYYNPHIQRPAIFPPSDGYLPPEDPLTGVARQIDVTRRLKATVPDLPLVGTAYSYLQDFAPHVAQGVVRAGWCDAIGLGRMVLSYPELPADTLAGRPMARKRVCRTFSDCTTGPRGGLVSGCYPLDGFYKAMPEAEQVKALKLAMRSA
jgi:NADPH2 dehydrogenase